MVGSILPARARKKAFIEKRWVTSLVVPWLRILLPMQGMSV